MLEIIRGDTISLPITIKDSDGVAIDITGATVFFTIKSDETLADTSASVSKTVTSHPAPASGQTTVELDPTDTEDLTAGIYYWDIQIKYSDDTIQSTKAQQVRVLADITRRTT